MPRFAFGGEEENRDPYSLTPQQQTPDASLQSYSGASYGGNHAQQEASVRLLCQSPDGSLLYCLGDGGRYIESRALPLEPQREGRVDTNDTEVPRRIRTAMPEWLQAALQLDAPIELLCVEGESVSRKHVADGIRQISLSQLCLYTKKGAYLLELAYEGPSHEDNFSEYVTGILASVTQPFEPHLESSTANEILRIRPAPQRYDGFATMCRKCCMAALVLDTDLQDYKLMLYHGSEVTIPLEFGMEYLQDGSREQIVDFCFAQSSDLSLFSSSSIILLKGSGDLYTAGPAVFDGAVISTTCLRESLDYLDAVIDTEDRRSARWRQCRAAQQYFLDIFGGAPSARAQFATARIVSQLHMERSVVNWPAQLQGPILFHSAAQPGPQALVLENFGSNQSSMVGVAVGKLGFAVDFALLSPTALTPRFVFCTIDDSRVIDDIVCKLGAWVERLAVTQPDRDYVLERSVALLKDPVADTLLHYATPRSVVTVSTNALRTVGRAANGIGPSPSLRTTAWSCLQMLDEGSHLQGITISKHSDDEHFLIACLGDGSTVDINLTEQQFKNEVEMLLRGDSKAKKLLELTDSTSGLPVASLDSSPPLYETIQDLVKKIHHGLGNMGKIAGSSTNFKDITPETLAVVMQIKEQCDKELVLPLLELQKIVSTRRNKLNEVLESQRIQLKALREAETERKKQLSDLLAKADTIESNSSLLLERATHAYEACQALTPKITDAESAFFKDVERLKEKCKYMEAEMKRMEELCDFQCGLFSEATVSESVNPIDYENARKMNILLDDMGNTMKAIRARLADAEAQSKSLDDK